MNFRLLSFLLLLLTLSAAGCAQKPAAPSTLNVFAAASLTEVFSEIGKQFEATHPGVTVVFNFAGSQQLAQQISEGAPADVFASANDKQMDVLIDAGLVESGTQRTFAQNRLVVIYPIDNPAGLEALRDLAEPGLKLVFAAQEVPVGQYTLEFLEKAVLGQDFGPAYKENVLNNVVSYEDNVRSVLAKVLLGEADAGIVYASDISPENVNEIGQLDMPDQFNVIASYPIAPVRGSKNENLAQAFTDFILSQECQNLLAQYNFLPIK
jgi:molybdate transport system substrate-binding protein